MKAFLFRAALVFLIGIPLFAGPTHFPGGARGPQWRR